MIPQGRPHFSMDFPMVSGKNPPFSHRFFLLHRVLVVTDGSSADLEGQPHPRPPGCKCHLGSVPWGLVIFNISTSSTAQGGGGSFKNRKPIGEVGCCESGMAERSH